MRPTKLCLRPVLGRSTTDGSEVKFVFENSEVELIRHNLNLFFCFVFPPKFTLAMKNVINRGTPCFKQDNKTH